MKELFLVHLFCTCTMTGVIWIVQILVYPAFSQVTPASFSAYHRHHTATIALLVAPLMVLELGSAVGLLALPSSYALFPLWLQVVSLAALLAIWCSTAFLQVPDHNRLQDAFHLDAHGRLVTLNWLRTGLWTLRSLLLLWVTRSALHASG